MLRSFIRSGLSRTYWLLDYSTAIFQTLCLRTLGTVLRVLNSSHKFQDPAYAAAATAGTTAEVDAKTLPASTSTTTTSTSATNGAASAPKASKEVNQNGSTKPQKRPKPDNYDEGTEELQLSAFGIAWSVTIAMIANFQRHFRVLVYSNMLLITLLLADFDWNFDSKFFSSVS